MKQRSDLIQKLKRANDEQKDVLENELNEIDLKLRQKIENKHMTALKRYLIQMEPQITMGYGP